MSLSNLQTNRYEKCGKQIVLRHSIPIIGLMVIAGIAYGVFYAPILYSDDWSLMIGRWYFGKLRWFDVTELRPLFKARLIVLYSIFGLNIHAFYIVLWILNVINAVQLYFLMLRFIPRNVAVAFSMAALVLVYPADFTHMWLTMLQVRTVVTLTLLYAQLLLIYADTERRIALWGAWLCLIISFGMHEYQFGVTMTWSLLLALMKRTSSRKKILWLLSPFLIGFVFLLWHAFATSLLGVVENYRYVSDLVFTPGALISRLLRGFQIMVWAWVEPVMLVFNLNTPQAVLVILLAIAGSGLLVHLLGRVYPKLRGVQLTTQEHLAQLRVFMMMVMIGPVFMAAGYIPVVALFQPSVFPIGSRVNLFALLGASVALVSLVVVVVMVFKRRQPEIDAMVTAMIVPLILLGVAIQLQVRYDDRTSWEEQKQMWREFFDLVPDLNSGTVVYFIFADEEERIPSLNRNKRRTPLRGAGDVAAALNILYGKNDLHGDVTSKELLLEQGVRNYYTGSITPYDHSVFMVFDGRPKRLRVVEDLQLEGLVDFPVPTYTPYEHISQAPTDQTQYRWLVGVEISSQEE